METDDGDDDDEKEEGAATTTTTVTNDDRTKEWPRLPRTSSSNASSILSKTDAFEILEISPTPKATVGEEDDADISRRIKVQYRKLCLKYHPDKNSPSDAERASQAFTAITAAYHTLTTVNFNQEKWLKSFSIPPMQSLSDVLSLALKGADPEEIERLMRARGEYRPHRNFGIDYNVRWESGEKPDPEGGLFRETAMNEYSDTRMLSDGFDSMRVGEDREKRPWEVVGGVGYDNQSLLLGDTAHLHHKRKY